MPLLIYYSLHAKTIERCSTCGQRSLTGFTSQTYLIFLIKCPPHINHQNTSSKPHSMTRCSQTCIVVYKVCLYIVRCLAFVPRFVLGYWLFFAITYVNVGGEVRSWFGRAQHLPSRRGTNDRGYKGTNSARDKVRVQIPPPTIL